MFEILQISVSKPNRFIGEYGRKSQPWSHFDFCENPGGGRNVESIFRARPKNSRQTADQLLVTL